MGLAFYGRFDLPWMAPADPHRNNEPEWFLAPESFNSYLKLIPIPTDCVAYSV